MPPCRPAPGRYCTGGIRCDVYSTFLRKKGFNNLYTLEGGVQNYLRQEGPDFWKGSLVSGAGCTPLGGACMSTAAEQTRREGLCPSYRVSAMLLQGVCEAW